MNNDRHEQAIANLMQLVERIYDQLHEGAIPQMQVPLRSKKNIEFNTHENVWRYGSLQTDRTAKSIKGAQMMLRTLHMVDFIRGMVSTNKSSTLREMYYISEGWGNGKFGSQDESNLLAEDLEIVSQSLREDFKLRPEEDGARVIGDLTIVETDRKGKMKTINCRDDVGDSGYSIPYNVEKEKINIKSAGAKFIVAIETGGMFDRLVENGFDEKSGALLVH
ncbi:MAG: DNA topoisomerase VI, partial [Candidatus Methanomethylophilaceae archaeon]